MIQLYIHLSVESVPGTEKTLQSICAATNKVSVESDVEIDSPVAGYEIYQVDMVEERTGQ